MDQKSEIVVGLGPVKKKKIYYLSSNVRNCDFFKYSMESLYEQN